MLSDAQNVFTIFVELYDRVQGEYDVLLAVGRLEYIWQFRKENIIIKCGD